MYVADTGNNIVRQLSLPFIVTPAPTDVWNGVGDWNTNLSDWSLGAAPTSGQNVEIQSGTVTHSIGSDSFAAITVDSGATLDITGGSTLTAATAAGVDITDNGTINIGDASTAGNLVIGSTTGEIAGTGVIAFGTSVDNMLSVAGSTLQIDANITIQGQNGQINGSGAVINDSVIDANTSGDTITINPTTFTNNGTVEAENGATVDVNPGSLTNVTGTTLTGGVWSVFDNSTVNLHHAITINAADVDLFGSTAVFSNVSGLTTNQGGFGLFNGASFTTTGDLSNTGLIDDGGSLSVHGNFTQSCRRYARGLL